MKGLVLSQPWASLVALGEKRVETRNWRQAYRGPIAIYAGKGLGGISREDGKPGREEDLNAVLRIEPFASVLSAHLGEHDVDELRVLLPRGRVIAIATVADVVPAEQAADALDQQGSFLELAFGNYTAGRYAWVLDDVRPVDPYEIPAGAVIDYRGLFDIPDSIAAEISARAIAVAA